MVSPSQSQRCCERSRHVPLAEFLLCRRWAVLISRRPSFCLVNLLRGETINRRAVCGRTARTVRREGRLNPMSLSSPSPYQLHCLGNKRLLFFTVSCFFFVGNHILGFLLRGNSDAMRLSGVARPLLAVGLRSNKTYAPCGFHLD